MVDPSTTVRGFMVVETHTDGCTYHCDVPVKVWLDEGRAAAHAAALNLGAYRTHWIREEQERRMTAAEERLPRVSPKDRIAVRIAALKASEVEVPCAFDALGITKAPDDFHGPFSVQHIDVE